MGSQIPDSYITQFPLSSKYQLCALFLSLEEMNGWLRLCGRLGW